MKMNSSNARITITAAVLVVGLLFAAQRLAQADGFVRPS
jgi:hypothetical protein